MTCPKGGTANADGSTFSIGGGRDLAADPASAAPSPPAGSSAPSEGASGSSGSSGSSGGSPWPEQQQGWNPPPPGYGQSPPPPPAYGNPGYGQQQYGQYGQPQYGQYSQQPWQGSYYGGPPVKNNMAMSVVSLVLGAISCLIFGVPGLVAVIYSSQVSSKLAMGDVAGAQQSARNAKTWAIVGYVLVGVVAVGLIILVIIAAANTSTDSGTF